MRTLWGSEDTVGSEHTPGTLQRNVEAAGIDVVAQKMRIPGRVGTLQSLGEPLAESIPLGSSEPICGSVRWAGRSPEGTWDQG